MFLLFCRLLLILIAKVEKVLKILGSLLHDRHKNLENQLKIAEIISIVKSFN